jgi:hypothetical protein
VIRTLGGGSSRSTGGRRLAVRRRLRGGLSLVLAALWVGLLPNVAVATEYCDQYAGCADLTAVYVSSIPRAGKASPSSGFTSDWHCRIGRVWYYAPTSGTPLTYSKSIWQCGSLAAISPYSPNRAKYIQAVVGNSYTSASAYTNRIAV